jgi:hypothetical protein
MVAHLALLEAPLLVVPPLAVEQPEQLPAQVQPREQPEQLPAQVQPRDQSAQGLQQGLERPVQAVNLDSPLAQQDNRQRRLVAMDPLLLQMVLPGRVRPDKPKLAVNVALAAAQLGLVLMAARIPMLALAVLAQQQEAHVAVAQAQVVLVAAAMPVAQAQVVLAAAAMLVVLLAAAMTVVPGMLAQAQVTQAMPVATS